ncbi:DUF2306 domain-containing protein [Virgisporangium aurantiacum]|uniref:Uncharacterized protein n=1 Tax=Virgisporangium aurantiacum TaxID=175570 RepID=A0A8J3ZNU3_9ACTN|nr:DUF2306 domain-containing protein [Virgisporangium aurantiacum]GIJ64956.1 hypothetical protein Vau01_124720 [Virgisporangium aurantiacum]
MSERVVSRSRTWLRLVQVAAAGLVVFVLLYAAMRVWKDVPHLVHGTQPADDIDRAYVEHPWLAYLHIAPGVLYLLGAPLQLAYRFRSRHYDVHRRLGRVLLVAALLSGVFAVVFGFLFSFGGVGEAAASVVFGGWFLACLVAAFRAVRRGDIVQHRRWMIRAFTVAIGVGTIRIWIIVLPQLGVLGLKESFAPAFWISFVAHVLVAEWWVRTTPHPPG